MGHFGESQQNKARMAIRIVAGIKPLSAGAELKCRDRVLGKGGKNSFIALPGKEGSQQANVLKTMPRPFPHPH